MATPRAKKAKALTLEEKLAGASRSEHVVTVCVNGRLSGEIERLDSDLAEARKRVPDTMAQAGDLRKMAERIEALREEMEAYNIAFTLRGLSRVDNNKLKAAHPPRKGNDEDRLRGFDESSFFVPLVRACIVEPELTDVQYEHLVNNMSDGEFSKLALGAYAATEGGVSVPFSSAASSVLRSFDATSSPQSA